MILHRQGTQPRLMDSSEHSSLSINLNLRKRNSTTIGQLSDVPTCMQSLSRTPRVLFMLFRMHGSLQLAS